MGPHQLAGWVRPRRPPARRGGRRAPERTGQLGQAGAGGRKRARSARGAGTRGKRGSKRGQQPRERQGDQGTNYLQLTDVNVSPRHGRAGGRAGGRKDATQAQFIVPRGNRTYRNRTNPTMPIHQRGSSNNSRCRQHGQALPHHSSGLG